MDGDERADRRHRQGFVSRRRFLALASAGLLPALAGCNLGESNDGGASPTRTRDTPAGGIETGPTSTTDARQTTATGTAIGSVTATGTPASNGEFDTSVLDRSPSSSFAPTAGFASVDWLAERDPEIVRVTNLDSSGEGSLRWALELAVPRVVIFEVGGVIDLQGEGVTIGSGNLYVAGQTAPSPGITVIRGGIFAAGRNTIVQHIRVRPGDELTDGEIDGNPSGSATDALSVDSDTPNAVFDHCSVSWGSDENMSASGGTENENVTFSNNLIAEGLSKSPLHPEVEHSKGTLVNDYATNVAVIGNVYAHNTDRHPRIKGASEAAAVNNLVYDFVEAVEMGGGPTEPAYGSIVGNYYKAGRATDTNRPLVIAEGQAGARAYLEDNVSKPEMPIREGDLSLMSIKYVWPKGIEPIAASKVPTHNLSTAGARPADRTPHDERIVADVREGTGRIIDSQTEVGGYPDLESTERALSPPAIGDGFAAWLFEHTTAVELSDARSPEETDG